MRHLLIGQAPGPNAGIGDPVFNGPGQSGARFPALCGLEQSEFWARIDSINLLDCFPGKAGKGDAFQVRRARISAMMIFNSAPAGTRIFLAGKNVAKAFGFSTTRYFRWRQAGRVKIVTVPHPSGVNLWWNDKRNVRNARRFFKKWFAGKGE